jgi:hypothetical protein
VAALGGQLNSYAVLLGMATIAVIAIIATAGHLISTELGYVWSLL